MKRITIIAICIFALFSMNLSAQKINVWKGGAPGHESDWHFFKNWSLGKAPDVFDAVIIPDISTSANRYPVVAAGQIEVYSLEIQAGASLKLHRSASILTENFVNYGACEGCGVRIRLEGSNNMALSRKKN